MNERIYYVLNEILNLGYTNMEVGINYMSGTNKMAEYSIADELDAHFDRYFSPNEDADKGAWDDIQTNYIYVYVKDEDVERFLKQEPDFFSVPTEDGDNWIMIFA